jgi:hypothetical protein
MSAVPVQSPGWAQPPFERMAAAASGLVGDRELIVYGSVLPWRSAPRHAPELAKAGESSSAMFARFLAEQVADIRSLIEAHPSATVLWAGDFNQSLLGPNHGGTTVGRQLLQASLDGLGFDAWNRAEAHAASGMCAIDLICGPSSCSVSHVGRIDPHLDGQRLSDHAGYFVDLEVA